MKKGARKRTVTENKPEQAFIQNISLNEKFNNAKKESEGLEGKIR